MFVEIVVTFLALSNYRDSLLVNRNVYFEADESKTIILEQSQPILLEYGSWNHSFTPCFSGYLDVSETRASSWPEFEVTFVPTVHVLMTHSVRRNGVDYLPQTLESWRTMPKPFHLTVFSTDRPTSYATAVRYVHKASNDHSIQSHKQDVIQMISTVQTNEATLWMFAEDDFPPCPSMRLMQVFRNLPCTFSGMVLAVGMTGLVFQTADAVAIKEYIEQNIRRPKQIDHLLQEWLLKEKPESRRYLGSRRPLTSREMQFNHIGTISTVGHHHASTDFNCGDSMRHANFPGLNYRERGGHPLRSWSG